MCAVRICSEFESAKPFKSASNSVVKSFNCVRISPILTDGGQFISMLKMACVAHAF